MAYTGTGTEADPYLVSTLTDFLTCAKMSNKYVKVISDIDAADDENYTGEITEPVYIGGSTKVYADEEKTISGITCTSGSLLQFGETSFIENICFSNMEHKPVNAATAYEIYAGKNTQIRNVKLSSRISIVSNIAVSLRLLYNGGNSPNSYTEFALDITLNVLKLSNTTLFDDRNILNKCNITIRNMTINNGADIHFTNSYSTSLTRCSVVFKNLNLESGYLNLPANYSNTYFSFVNSKIASGLTNASTTAHGGNGILLCFQDCTDGEGNPKTTDERFEDKPPFDVVTPEQLKDKAYLTEIGFLP